MEYTTINNLDKKLSRFVMGTFGMYPNEKIDTYFERLDTAVDLGISTFDTAQAYGSEPVLGRWMKERGNREDVVVLSKGAHPSLYRVRVTPYDISSDLFESLAELDTGYIDLYLLHRDNAQLPVGPIVEVLNEHCAAGRIKAFGGSNWTHQRIQEANEYAYAHNLKPFAVSSPNYSLAEQVDEPWAPGCVSIGGDANVAAREWYTANQMPVFAYSSLAHGLMTGRITREMFQNTPEKINEPCRLGYCHERNFLRLDRAAELAREMGVTIPQIAMAFILCSPLNVFPIIGAENRAEMQSSFAALNVKLTQAQCDWLDLKRDDR